MGQVLEGIYGWIRNIACFLCFMNVFLQVLPGEGYRKYVRFFGSLLLVVLVMAPLGNIVQISGDFEQIWEKESRREAYDDLEITMQGMDELRMKKIDLAYEEEMKRQIEEIFLQNGLVPTQTELSFEKEEGVKKISGVRICAREEVQLEGEERSRDLERIKKEMEDVYQIDSAHIHIDIEE